MLQIIVEIIEEKKPSTVKELVNLVKEKYQISEQQILNSLIKLQAEGKITFIKHLGSISLSFVAYLKTEETLWYWLTIAIAIITAAVVFTIPENFYPWVYVRYILGAIFVLWLPGYTFIKALFPNASRKQGEKSLDIIERIALSIGMSLALVPIVGLLLNYTPWGIRLTPIVLSLLALTVIFATAALVRHYRNQIQF